MTSIATIPPLDASIVNSLATTSGTAASGDSSKTLMSLASASTDVSLSQTAVSLSMEQGIVSSLGGQATPTGIYDSSGLLQLLELPGPQTNQSAQGNSAAMSPQTSGSLSLDQGIVSTLLSA